MAIVRRHETIYWSHVDASSVKYHDINQITILTESAEDLSR